MALDGIGNGAGSALERFQRMRDLAQKKLDAPGKPDITELIQRKQKEMGAGASAPGAAARISAERILPKPAATPDNNSAAAAFGAANAPSSVYGRSGAAKKQDAAPRLGQYVDFLA